VTEEEFIKFLSDKIWLHYVEQGWLNLKVLAREIVELVRKQDNTELEEGLSQKNNSSI
jgi:hypothetical protein